MAKYIGLDLGSKTVGIATSEGYFSNPKETIRFQEYNFLEAVNKLDIFLKKEGFEKIAIGYPKNMNGSTGERVEMVEEFIKIMLEQNLVIEEQIERVDERLTTRMAKQIMISADLSRKKQKENKDQLAAKLILETYLNSIK
ncbi:Holliday junction resolvase RuvX [Spiroplasma cantharicola]|uniref:Putative pre-16S rRNA nuclease n=1 Tax=Spiroplasma cantharicola TaxID=362837 RepID=A0A0M4JRQ8_9MOLU|nr:Holliday junction resolvase RuvX [Spiroplasma cantharicola]ALD66097.1 Holliday junction resolvase-like protein [Spiroplasma cantharicola]